MKILLFIMTALMLNHTAQGQRQKVKPLTIVVKTEIKTSSKDAFEYIVPVELSHIFKKHKSLPAVTGTSNKELWYTPGMQRRVFFEDGNTAQESLINVTPYSNFSYRIDSFTSPLRKLAKHIEGNWEFEAKSEKLTHIEWSYSIVPKNKLTRFFINSLLKNQVKGLLENALLILKNDLENQKKEILTNAKPS